MHWMIIFFVLLCDNDHNLFSTSASLVIILSVKRIWLFSKNYKNALLLYWFNKTSSPSFLCKEFILLYVLLIKTEIPTKGEFKFNFIFFVLIQNLQLIYSSAMLHLRSLEWLLNVTIYMRKTKEFSSKITVEKINRIIIILKRS